MPSASIASSTMIVVTLPCVCIVLLALKVPQPNVRQVTLFMETTNLSTKPTVKTPTSIFKVPFRVDWLRWLLAPALGIVIWQAWIAAANSDSVPSFILPHPADVLDRMVTLYERGVLMRHVQATAQEALIGLLVAIALALPLGYLVARNKWISALLMPYLVAIRAVPVVAIAAVVIIWLGTGIESKIFVAAFITWFPLMEATIIGIQSVDTKLRDLMRSYQATPLQLFYKLELPAAMPNLLSGMKIAATLSVVGAAVGELIASSEGLAYLILFGRGTSDSSLVFGAVLLLTLLSLILYSAVALAEYFLLSWRRLT